MIKQFFNDEKLEKNNKSQREKERLLSTVGKWDRIMTEMKKNENEDHYCVLIEIR